MQLRFFAAPLVCVFAVGGCATQDQLRQTEAQSAEQNRAVQALRAGADRNQALIGELRGEIRRTQESVRRLEAALADSRARADAARVQADNARAQAGNARVQADNARAQADNARVQADNATAISRDFLTNLIAAREEQHRQLGENGAAFADLARRLADLESRLRAQQRLLEQGGAASSETSRRLAVVEAALAEAGRKSAALEAGARTGREADDSLTRQLATLRAKVEETRSVISSEGLLQMMRELEGVRRAAASLRGSVEELQQAQNDASARSRNYYLDLDTRIRVLQQQIPQPDTALGAAPTDPDDTAGDVAVPVPETNPAMPETAPSSPESEPGGAQPAVSSQAPDALSPAVPTPPAAVSDPPAEE